ncbi:MAG: hypothetical protein ABS888_03800 [Eubacteriales bacterium]
MKLCSNRGGVNRVIALLLAAIAVMLVVVLLPAWDDLRLLSQRLSCEQAMKSAKDGLIIEYLGRFKEGSVQDAMNTLDQVMIARPNICPAGGEVYLIKNSDGIYEPLCGLHDRNERQRTRLNASRALELLREKRRAALRSSKGVEPDAVTITLNSQPLSCVWVDKAQKLRRGTATTDGFDGVVAFYGLAGEGSFPAEDVEEGDIFYFVYADENHCAIWKANDGWSGDAYWQQ